jgi:hypothetical protein
MWNLEQSNLSEVPKLYANEHIPLKETVVHLHFFISGCDWFITEFDGKETMFGYAILGGDYINAEWGYMNLEEMKAINIGGTEIECDLYWKKRPAGQIDKIVKGCGWVKENT